MGELLTDVERNFDDLSGALGRWVGNGGTLAWTSNGPINGGSGGSAQVTADGTVGFAGMYIDLDTSEHHNISVVAHVINTSSQPDTRANITLHFYTAGMGSLISTVVGAYDDELSSIAFANGKVTASADVPAGAAVVRVMVLGRDDFGYSLPAGTKFNFDGVSVWEFALAPPADPGPAGSTFYALMGWTEDGNWLCEWKLDGDTPVHVRHAQFDDCYPWTTWITASDVWVVGWSDSDPTYQGRAIRFDRATLTEQERRHFVDDGVGPDVAFESGDPGGVINDGANIHAWVPNSTELHTHPIDGTPDVWESEPTVTPLITASGVTPVPFGDLAADRDTIYYSEYADGWVARSRLSNPSEFDLLVDLQGDWTTSGTTPAQATIVVVERDYEDLTTGGWTAESGFLTLSNVATPNPEGGSGARSLRFQNSSGVAEMSLGPFDVGDPREGWSWITRIRNQSGGSRTMSWRLRYLDGAGNPVHTVTSGNVNLAADFWSLRTWRTSDNQPNVETLLSLGIAQVEFVFRVEAACDLYIDMDRIEATMAFPQFTSESIKVSAATGKVYAAIVGLNGPMREGQFPSYYADTHTFAVLELDPAPAAGGSILNWWPLDPIDAPNDYPPTDSADGAFTLVLTPDDTHVVTSQLNNVSEPSGTASGVIWCRNLATGVEAWTSVPHPGYDHPLTQLSLQHIGAHHDVGAARIATVSPPTRQRAVPARQIRGIRGDRRTVTAL